MANMNFGVNLLPSVTNSSLTLGNSSHKWTIYGTLNGSATSISPSDTSAKFWRGDNTWSNTLNGTLFLKGTTNACLEFQHSENVGDYQLYSTVNNFEIWRKDSDWKLGLQIGRTTGLLTVNGGISANAYVKTYSTGESRFQSIHSTTGIECWLDNCSDGTHGIWSNGYYKNSTYTNSGAWLLYRDTNGRVFVNGKANVSPRLGADDSAYNYESGSLYYAHLSWNTNNDNRWYLRVAPESPKTIAVDYAYEATKATQDADGNTISSSYVKKSGDTMTGSLTTSGSLTAQCYININPYPNYGTTGVGRFWYNGSDSTSSSYRKNSIYVQDAQNFCATNIYGAVWNDYAEFRKADTIEPGYCIKETTNGMTKTTARLEPGVKVISDTFGFAIGETEQCKTPIAVSGRVLVYPYQDKNKYELGAAVCSAPNGTVDIMTREEIKEYPERIVGTVSEIPDYEVWNIGNGDRTINVDGRIWIYVK